MDSQHSTSHRNYPLTQRTTRSMKSQNESGSVCFKTDCRTDYQQTYKTCVMPSYNHAPPQNRNPQTNQWTPDSKVIKFTGNMRDNINELLRSLECSCGAKQDFAQILFTYGDKITKLREERAKHKQNALNFKKQAKTAQQEIVYKNRQMDQLEENYYITRRDSVAKGEVERRVKESEEVRKRCGELEAKNEELRRRLKEVEDECQEVTKRLLVVEKEACERNLRGKDQTCLLDLSLDPIQQGSLRQSNMMIKLERYENLFRQLPMEFDEIAKMLKDYATDLPCFASRQQRQLYFMATRMNSNLWKKKLELQIKDLCEKRQALRKIQDQTTKRKLVPLQPIVNGKYP